MPMRNNTIGKAAIEPSCGRHGIAVARHCRAVATARQRRLHTPQNGGLTMKFQKSSARLVLFTCVLLAASSALWGAAAAQAGPPVSQPAEAPIIREAAAPASLASALPGAASPGSIASAPHLGQEITISAIDIVQHLPEAAYNWKRQEYLVVWHNQWPIQSRDIQGARVSASGQVLATFTISEGLKDRAQPAVAYDPVRDRYLVTWIFDDSGNGANWDVYGRFIPADGPTPALPEFVICNWTTTQWNPRVAYGRTQDEFMVVWWTEHPTLPGYVSGRRVSAGGGFPANAFLIASHATQQRVGPDIAYNLARNEYLVVYHNGLDVFGTRLQGNGNILGGGEFGIAGWPSEEIDPSVAACHQADRYLVGWQSRESGNFNVYARYVNGDGAPADVHQIDARSLDEVAIDVACDDAGMQFMLAWQVEYVSHKFGIWGRFASPTTILDPAFPVVAASWTAGRTTPAIAGGDSRYLVVWEHERDGTSFQDIHGRIAASNAAFMPLLIKRRP